MESTRRFYDRLTRLFLALGSAPRIQTIHRALWLRSDMTLEQALDSVHALLLAELEQTSAAPDGALLVADLGCGVGASLFALLRGLSASARAVEDPLGVGVTISPLQARLARRAARQEGLSNAAQFLVADFEALPLRPGFDFAYSIEAFVHARDPQAYFAQVAALLRPGGRLALVDDFLQVDPADQSPEQRCMVRVFQRGWHAPTFVTVTQAAALAQRNGLRLVKATDLTAFLRLRALPDALARFLAALGEALPGEQLFVRNLLGSMALQQCLRDGVSGYHLLVFEKPAPLQLSPNRKERDFGGENGNTKNHTSRNGKTIVLLAAGTRGDVQPYIALGIGLRAAGYQVRVAAPERFADMVAARGLDFAPLRGNPSDLMARPGRQDALAPAGAPLRGLRASLGFLRAARPLYAAMLTSAWEACRGADALVSGLASIWGLHLAEALRVPNVWAFLQPFERTRVFPSPLLPVMGAGGATRALNRLTYRLIEQAVWLPWRAEVNAWRRAHGLSPVGLSSPYAQISRADAAVVYGFSARVVAPAPDWPPDHHVCGYWFLDAPADWQPPPALIRFLEAGDPPVYIGFGSPGTARPERSAAILLRALQETGLRALVDLPAGALRAQTDPRRIYPVNDVPHDWLFARAAGLVHHGGAGTTGAGLRAGAPTCVAPLAVDQFFWGRCVQALGVGPAPLPQRHLDAAQLAQRLNALAHDAAVRQRAVALGAALREEDGVAEAVIAIRQALAD